MVKLDRNHRAGLRVLDLEGTVKDADLQPMVAIELRDQVTGLVAKGKLLAVAREHNLRDIHAEELALLGLAKRIEQDIIDCAFSAAHDSLSAVLVKEHGLILHVDLLLQLQILLSKDQDLALQGHIDVCRGAHGAENFHSLALAVDRCNQAEVIRREEVDLIRILPNELVLVALQLVAPGEDQLTADVLDVSRLEVIQLHRAVRAVVDSQRVVRRQLHLLKLQVYGLVDAIDEFVDTGIDGRQYGRLLIDLELELGQQVLVERILRRLHLVEQFQNLSLA